MTRSILRLACIGLVAVSVAWGANKSGRKETTPESEPAVRTVSTVAQLRAGVIRLRSLQLPMDPPQPGDWLAEHKENGQTFNQFLVHRPNPAPSELTTLYIQPIGNFGKTQQRLVVTTARCLGLFYGRPVKMLPGIGLDVIPEDAQRINAQTRKTQILSTYVLDKVLKPKRPPDALAVLALSAEDLWPGKGWNYVFGQASLSERVGVWSIQRFGIPNASAAAYQLCLERTLGTALHETGHMLGISHCTAWQCGMNGRNSLEESDRGPLHFCSECQAKVWWSCNLEPQKHLTELIEFANQHELEDSAEYWQTTLELIKAK